MQLSLAPGVPNTGANKHQSAVERPQQLVGRRDFSGIRVEGNLVDETQESAEPTLESQLEAPPPAAEAELVESAEPTPPTPPKRRKKKKVSAEVAAPPLQPPSHLSSPPWFLLVGLLVILIAFSIAIYGRATQMQATSNTLSRNVYPLWLEPHDTTSAPITDVHQPHVRPMLASLEKSFLHYMDMGSQYECLCMHHLKVPGVERNAGGASLYQVCAVKGGAGGAGTPIYLLINPTLIGGGNKTDYYMERSVSCPSQTPTGRYRRRTAFVQWTSVTNGGDTLWMQFSEGAAACMQLALDEINGRKHC